MARTKKRTRAARPKRRGQAILTAVFGLVLGAILGVSAIGLYELFGVADANASFQSMIISPTHRPNATPSSVPADWHRVTTWSVPILMYHHVRDLPQNKFDRELSVSPETFTKQLDYLSSHGFTTITFAELAQGVLPPKPVILTFDDGGSDGSHTVFPALREHRMRGTFYLVSGFIGDQNSMTWSDVETMSRAGMEFGGHTVSHADLEKSSPAQQERQITESIQAINKHTGEPVITFAYPSGKWNPDTLRIVQAAGIEYSVTTVSGLAADTDNPELLPRYRIDEATDFSALLP